MTAFLVLVVVGITIYFAHEGARAFLNGFRARSESWEQSCIQMAFGLLIVLVAALIGIALTIFFTVP